MVVDRTPDKITRVFISHSSKDIDYAQQIYEGIKKAGYDPYLAPAHLRHMDKWPRELAQELAACDVLILLWSNNAAKSEFVKSEWQVARALEKGIIICLVHPLEDLKKGNELPADLGDCNTIYQATIADTIRLIIETLKNPDRIPRRWNYNKLPAKFFVPFPLNPDFVGRKELLLELYLHFLGNLTPIGINQTVTAMGMGGIGKTQLAVEFCYRFAYAFPDGILWINAARPLIAEFCDGARRLGITVERPDTPDADNRLLNALQNHISRHRGMLIVLDNLAQPADALVEILPGFKPAALGCSLLITTRSQDLPIGMQPLQVNVLPEEDALALLTKDNPPENQEEENSARAICYRVGFLPLAIDMVRAYLRTCKGAVSYYTYLLNLRNRIATIEKLGKNRPLATHSPELLAVFDEQYALVKNEDARLLFALIGQMDEAEQIPVRRLEIFSGLFKKRDPLQPPLRTALNELTEKSLLEELEGEKVRFHPLVWEYSRSQLNQSAAKELRVNCARFCQEKYQDINAVAEEWQAREYDIDSVSLDLELAWLWADRDVAEKLVVLSRLISREAHNLRLKPDEKPDLALFYQQIAYRAARMGLGQIVEQIAEEMNQQGSFFLRPFSAEPVEDLSLIRYLKGHSGWVRAVAVCPDGKTALSGSSDRTLIVWDLETGRQIRTLKGHSGYVSAVAVCPDGKTALSGADDQTLIVWDLETGRQIRTLEGHSSSVNAVAVCPDGKTALSGAEDKTLIVWDLETGKPLLQLSLVDEVRALAVSNNRIVAGLANGNLEIFELIGSESAFNDTRRRCYDR